MVYGYWGKFLRADIVFGYIAAQKVTRFESCIYW